MTTTRRDFVRIAGTTTAAALLSSPAFAANEPALGLIFPPKDYPIPPDAKRLYPSGVEFLGDGVGLPGGMTIEGYEEAIPRVVPVAESLAKRGAKVISVFGSSLTFYKGAKFHEDSDAAGDEGDRHEVPPRRATVSSTVCARPTPSASPSRRPTPTS